MLQLSCSIVPELLEKVYGRIGKIPPLPFAEVTVVRQSK